MGNQRYEIRPLGPWIAPVTTNRQWRGRFRVGAKLVVIQIDVTEGDLRRDGMLRANAQVGFPGVRVSFDSRHGPLTYATDEYDHWQANVRAIALALQALRAVDRYGVTKSGEQYRGWQAIEAAPGPLMTADEAAQFIARQAGPDYAAGNVLTNPTIRSRAFKAAARRHHPDAGGDRADFERLTAARDLLDKTN